MGSHFKRRFLWLLLVYFGFLSPCLADWQPQTDLDLNGDNEYISLAADGQGNAMAIFDGFDTDISMGVLYYSYFTNGAWGAPQPFTTLPFEGSFDFPFVAMDPSGTGLAIWCGFMPEFSVQVNYFDGASWGANQLLDDNVPYDFNVSQLCTVAMNGPGSGIAAWVRSNDTVQVQFFSGGVPSAGPTGIAPAVLDTQLIVAAYSTNGSAVLGWWDPSGSVTVANFDGVSWNVPPPIGNSGSVLTNVQVGIDASGNALAAWVDGSGNVVTSYFNGSWQPSEILSIASSNVAFVSLAMSPSGYAVISWQDSSNNGWSRFFNGTAWEMPIQFGSNLFVPTPPNFPIYNGNGFYTYGNSNSVSIDDLGNAIVIWATQDVNYSIYGAQLPFGGSAWINEQFVGTAPANGDASSGVAQLLSAISPDPSGFALWQAGSNDFGDTFNVFSSSALLSFPPMPPHGIEGRVCKDKFATSADRVKIITWTPSIASSVIGYNVRKNGILVKTIPASGPFIYKDHNTCKKTDVYTVTSVSADGLESLPLTISVK